jgi:F0F1-type ATP synthase assembly protein I
VLLIFPHGGRRLALGYLLASIVAAVAAAILLEVTNFTWGVSIALSLTLFLIVVPVLGAFLVLRHADMEALKDRFIPKQTIETTKETVEWVREQMPLGRKS